MKLPRWTAAVVVAVALFSTAAAVRADEYAAIAYSPSTGSYGYWYGAKCRADAETGAMNNCNGSDRRVVVWVENGWAALAVNNNGGWGYGWSTTSRAQAERSALNGAGGARCGAHIICWAASGK
jgi:serine/threonine-protein kinase